MTTGDNVYNSGHRRRVRGPLVRGTSSPSSTSRPREPADLRLRGEPRVHAAPAVPAELPGAITAAQASGGRFASESVLLYLHDVGNQLPELPGTPSTGDRPATTCSTAAWADGTGGYQGDFLAHWNGSVSGCGPCGAELTWLKSDLASHASTPIKFAFFHYPLHADNSGAAFGHLPRRPERAGRAAWPTTTWIIVFNGHAHRYERNFRRSPASRW